MSVQVMHKKWNMLNFCISSKIVWYCMVLSLKWGLLTSQSIYFNNIDSGYYKGKELIPLKESEVFSAKKQVLCV